MSAQEADVLVVGMGPGGEDAAGRLARAGLSVVAIEEGLVGGECPYYGCIPTKMLVRAADALAEARRVDGLAGSAPAVPDLGVVARRIRQEATDDWDDTAAADRFTGAGGVLVRGRAVVTGPRSVRVGEDDYRARRALILDAGTDPVIPPIDGLAGAPYWTNREAVRITEAPGSLIVLGGGAIGCEFAQALARFGTRVDLIEAGDRLLPGEEPEAGRLVADALSGDGVRVHTGARVTRIDHDGSGFAVRIGDWSLQAERLLVAAGRRADLARLGLESIGVDVSQPSVPVDDHQRVREGVYAIGDLTGQGAFTHVSMAQARLVVADILTGHGPAAERHAIPHVVFTDPEVGTVGLTEERARAAGVDVLTSLTDLVSSTRGWIHGPGGAGLVKLVADRARRLLVGATVAAPAPAGGEVLSMLALAVHERIPLERLGAMIYAYPTFHRAVEQGVDDLLERLE